MMENTKVGVFTGMGLPANQNDSTRPMHKNLVWIEQSSLFGSNLINLPSVWFEQQI